MKELNFCFVFCPFISSGLNLKAKTFQNTGVCITFQDTNSGLACRPQWPLGLRRKSTADRLLRSWIRIPPGTWMSVCCECCVLSDRGLCDELITRPEESYQLWCVVVCDLEN